MIRFGLCCLFVEAPVRFRTATASSLSSLSRRKALEKLSGLCLANSENLNLALKAVSGLGFGAFRISSGLFPLFTHPATGYGIDDLPDAGKIKGALGKACCFAAKNDIRLSFHPDQFVVLSSHRDNVVANSAKELEYHGMLAELVGAEVINIHLGGRHGGKKDAIERFRRNFHKLPESVRRKLALENDDVSYTPSDLYELCMGLSLPMVYDVHHHRCNSDGLSIGDATGLCIDSWKKAGREPYFHISSPKNLWKKGNPRSHSDYIDPADFPACWLKLKRNFTLDVEAKAKELAVLRLMKNILD